MRRAPRRLQQGQGNTGVVMLAALAGFAIICGLAILVVSSGSKPEAAKAGPATLEVGTVSRQVQKALGSMNAAEGALNGANYGSIRGHLRRARESLVVLKHQIKEVKKASASKGGAKPGKK